MSTQSSPPNTLYERSPRTWKEIELTAQFPVELEPKVESHKTNTGFFCLTLNFLREEEIRRIADYLNKGENT